MQRTIYSAAKRILALLIVGITSLATMASAQTLAEKYNLPRLLEKSIMYFEHQISGTKPAWSRSYWRGNSQTNSGDDNSVELDGGWNDAGDNVKFNFPQAHAVTILCWTQLEYATAINNNQQKQNLLNNIKWGLDYLVRCHASANVIWGQVGNGATDHSYWRSPEMINYSFPSYKLDSSKPGTDLAMEFAAAFAAGYLVYKDINATYANSLLSHARQCFTFGDTYKGKYSDSITDAKSFYQSFSGYQDEISWAAAWLYRATNESNFLTRAQNEFTQVSGYAPAWDNKGFANSILLYKLTGSTTYRGYTESWIDSIQSGAGRTYTPGGLLWLQEFGPLPLAVGGAWGALLYTKLAGRNGTSTTAKYDNYRTWAFKQLDYALGNNPAGWCYVAGFKDDSVVNIHHRAGSGLLGYTSDNSNVNIKNRFIVEGALAGGPDSKDGFKHDRMDAEQSEAGVGTNCYLTAAAAALVDNFASTTAAYPAVANSSTNPTVDGTADSNYGTSRRSIAKKISGSTTTTDLSASWVANWTSTGLYIHVSVKDDASSKDSTDAFQDDSVEIYLDRISAGFSTYGAASNPFNSGTGYGAPNVFQYIFKRDATSAVVNGTGGTTTGVKHAWRSITGGYELEASFAWSALGGSRGSKQLMGLDVQVNDDDDGGDRDSQIAWNATSDINWRRPDNFGRIKLAAPSVTDPATTLAGNKRISDNANTLYLHCSSDANNSAVRSRTLDTSYDSQKWVFELVSGTTYRIKSVWSSRYLTAPFNSAAAVIQIQDLNSTQAQKWIATSLGSGNFRLQNSSSKLYLTAGATSSSDVTQNSLNSSSNAQIFKLPTY